MKSEMACSKALVLRKWLDGMRHDDGNALRAGLVCRNKQDEVAVPRTRLNGRFLIHTNQPDSFLQQPQRTFVPMQHWTSPFQKHLWVLDVLPGVVTPRPNALGFEPAANRAGRNGRQLRRRRHLACQFAPAPPKPEESDAAAASYKPQRSLEHELQGKNALVLPNGARRQANERSSIA